MTFLDYIMFKRNFSISYQKRQRRERIEDSEYLAFWYKF
jgi:hypothetical protein